MIKMLCISLPFNTKIVPFRHLIMPVNRPSLQKVPNRYLASWILQQRMELKTPCNVMLIKSTHEQRSFAAIFPDWNKIYPFVDPRSSRMNFESTKEILVCVLLRWRSSGNAIVLGLNCPFLPIMAVFSILTGNIYPYKSLINVNPFARIPLVYLKKISFILLT